ncbi:MAG: hypothetical protein KC964_31765, partial [Candidatus Omnitrophica bacterium]|nr:hypothetical protein [Candidatus Omnitrophota bacterium]
CIDRLPSSIAVRQFVQDELLPSARRGEKTVIVVRQAKRWGLDEGRGVVVYGPSEARRGNLNVKSPGGRAIAKALGLDLSS